MCMHKSTCWALPVHNFAKESLVIGVALITQATHVLNKNSNIQGRSLNVIKLIFHTIRNCP